VSITPFDADGRIDEAGFRNHLRRIAAAGIGVYVGGGGSGEGFVLSAAEHRRILELAAEELRGEVPLRAMGVETRSATAMID
jgi:4-hydroxy-tetrahydrodipicolinate synthase